MACIVSCHTVEDKGPSLPPPCHETLVYFPHQFSRWPAQMDPEWFWLSYWVLEREGAMLHPAAILAAACGPAGHLAHGIRMGTRRNSIAYTAFPPSVCALTSFRHWTSPLTAWREVLKTCPSLFPFLNEDGPPSKRLKTTVDMSTHPTSPSYHLHAEPGTQRGE